MKYIIFIFFLLILFNSCSTPDKQTNLATDEVSLSKTVVTTNNKDESKLEERPKQTEKVSYPIDSLKITSINELRDSLLSNKDNLIRIIKKQEAIECYATDSIYYSALSSISLSFSYSGCIADEDYSTYIYSSNGKIIYTNTLKLSDGLLYSTTTTYQDEKGPIFGIEYKNEIDWVNNKLTIISTSTDTLLIPLEEIETRHLNQKSQGDNILKDISELDMSSITDGAVKIIDTIKYEGNEVTYFLDSIVYAEIKTTTNNSYE